MSEYVYILTNPIYPDLVKIGRTKNIKQRMRNLSSSTGVPVPFQCYFCCEVKDSQDIENRLKFGLGDHRINEKREFFRIHPERVKVLLEGWSLGDATPKDEVVDSPEEYDSLVKERARRPVFTFSMVGIEKNSKLFFLKDETKIATVAGDREIMFEGKQSSLNQITMDLLKNEHGKDWSSVRGPDYWIYENETLTQRRIRLEKGEG